ncbi:Gfo/Idh/MocA family protein [Magnetofaba australis]|uniref:Putative oxidoreductase domain-containing protein n=1 Tax=Magnetofaba australis IT-1 TaxID=1434232 RepID=A0A1Y2JZ45_9PROT|nr:Gfo/Idh/MocA family oxidoreductase [Magnetofaba australis]OSM00180.1 putative oxidoreductase domain-containing protein [Magnetofaba australis IT-1]
MTAHTLRLGLIGCGRVAQHYRKILTRDMAPGVTISAVFDLDRAKAEDMAATFNATVHDSYAALLADPNVDMVVILTFSGLHFEHTKQALDAGKHVLIEKPVSLIPGQGAELQELADAKGVMCGVAFQNRFNPAIRALREVMDAGRLGKIVTASIRLRWCRFQEYYEDGWHGTWGMDGGVINQQAIHHADALNWLCGPIEAVCAAEARRMNKLEAEDTMTANVRFENGALGTIEVTTAARPEDFEASISVVGENGMITLGGIALNLVDNWFFIEPQAGDADAKTRCSQEVETGYGLSHGPLLVEIAERLAAGRTDAPISAADGDATTALVHALYASIERDGWVKMADKPQSSRLGS